ncbi:uncharacterized protein LOC130090957 [Rhinichthys klamathensis goyatoka]|uniref:uncharacterized protein LOC130090957 n=1 Tax=Rhinichthys klamathensis goyatoka TaxID=3034132 RepID=UPI0024B4ABF4|nr:uncharacterized protein LOC130090957 [Rhinichthys klamathensis goyatoka]
MSHQCLMVAIVVFITTEAISGQEVTKAVGDKVSFKLDKIVPPVTSITWKHIKKGALTVKVIEWEDGEETTVLNPRFKDITTLNKETGQITISKLTLEHTGVYTIDVSGKEQTQRFTLTVMEPVPKPVIKIEATDNPNVVYLICEYSETIIWKNSAGETLTGSAHQRKGEFINVKNKRNPEISYTCSLQNAVSEETSDPVYERDLFKGEEVTKAVGDKVSFKLDKIVPPVTSITWKHIKPDVLTVKAIEWEDGETTVLNPRFKDITTLNTATGQITISKLTLEHTGVYTIDVSGKEQTQRFTLTVMDPVPKPVIGREKINPDVVYLSCKYNGSITWSNSAGETLAYQSNTDSITVKKNEGNPENTYTCTLQNAVSKETSDPVYKKDLFNDESTGGPWWIVIIVLILVILIIAIIFAVYRYKHNKDFKKSKSAPITDCTDIEELSLKEGNTSFYRRRGFRPPLCGL